MKKFKKKGSYGYIKSSKIKTVIFTAALFGISLSIFFGAYIILGTKKNFFTILAVLGCLPAAKACVNMIMFLKAKSCPAYVKETLEAYEENVDIFYDLQITAYERAYQVDSIAMKEKTVVGFSSNPKTKLNDLEKHINQMLTQNGHKEYTVKIFDDFEKYKNRIIQLSETEKKANEEALQLLLDISL